MILSNRALGMVIDLQMCLGTDTILKWTLPLDGRVRPNPASINQKTSEEGH